MSAGKRALRLFCAVALAAFATKSSGEVPAEVDLSPDISVDLSGAVVADDEVAVDELGGPVSVGGFPGVPMAADVDAHGFDSDGNDVISLDIAAELPATGGGELIVRHNDVIRLVGAEFEKIFDATAAGVPAGADLDAVFVYGKDIFMSFDVSIEVGGVVAADEDVLRWDGANLSLYADLSELGIDERQDVDALHFVTTSGAMVVSFTTPGSVDGVPSYDDDDLLFYDPALDQWSVSFDGSALHDGWVNADVDAASPAYDSDGDGEVNRLDLCPQFSGNSAVDTDGNGIGDDCECGDQDEDGRLTINDILAINRVIFGLETESPLCDANDDQECNILDVLGVNGALFGGSTHCARNPLPVFP